MNPLRSTRLYIQDMLDVIEEIENYTKDVTLERFLSESMRSNAVLHQFMILGEAASHLPEELREQHPGIPWSQITAMRNKLIHKYPGVDLELTWDTVHRDLPPLKQQLTELLSTV